MTQTSIPNPVDLLQTLVRFNTTNPPGNEVACISYLNDIFKSFDIPTTLLARDANRPNLIARLPGRGQTPPVIWQAHVDVVTTENQNWAHPPFEGKVVDGYLWGRGTLDDKGAAAMMVSAMLRAKAKHIAPPGDIIFIALADEEVGADYGAKFLIEDHPEQFEGVRYAIGEGGGFSVRMGGTKFYPIMVVEKQICQIRLTVRGDGGHGSIPLQGQAMAKLANILQKLDRKRLPVHITPIARQMITIIAQQQPLIQRSVMRQLLNPWLTNPVLDLLGEQGQQLNAVLHNTLSPTIVQGGHRVNVIPSEIILDLDGRLLPGFGPDDMVGELRALLGSDVDIQVVNYEPGPNTASTAGYTTLSNIVQQADPTGVPFPYMVFGVTDARHFAKLGIQSYGFVPMQVPDELIKTIHGADERVPVQTLTWGTQVLVKTLQQFEG